MEVYLILAILIAAPIVILFTSFLIAMKNISNKQKIIDELEKKIQSQANKRPPSLELREFLADVMAGEALISVSRIDPNHLFMFSPKDRG